MTKIEGWLASRPPVEGERVFDITDPRHVGVLRAVRPTGGTVEWANGWLSEGIPMRRLRRYEGEE